jgi:hypothetical protein
VQQKQEESNRAEGQPMSKWHAPRLIEVVVQPNGGQEYGLLDTDAGLTGSVTRSSIKQGVGQLLHKHLDAGGKVVVRDRNTTKTVLEVVVNVPTLECALCNQGIEPGEAVEEGRYGTVHKNCPDFGHDPATGEPLALEEIDLSEGGCIEPPDEDGTIRRRDKDGNCESCSYRATTGARPAD